MINEQGYNFFLSVVDKPTHARLWDIDVITKFKFVFAKAMK